MLHVWLIPLLVLMFLLLVGLFLVVKAKGGTGVRSSGRTVTDHPQAEEDLPPGM